MDSGLSHPLRANLKSPPALRLDPNQIALLVVDMQYFDAHPEWGEGRTAIQMGVSRCFDPYFAQIDDIIPRIQHLLTVFRHRQMEVIHLRVAEWTKDSRDVGWKQLVRGLVVPSDSKEADLLAEVAPVDDELVVSKSSSGVFPVTNLDRLLRNMDIHTLVFTGTSTGGCVESAVRDAVDLGYNVIIVSDGCADSTLPSHHLALSRMDRGLARIMTTAEVEQAVNALPLGDRAIRSGTERVKPYLPIPPKTPPRPEGPRDINPYSLIFPPAIKLSLSISNSALILVDAIRYACDSTVGMGKITAEQDDHQAIADYYVRVKRALQQMNRLLAVCRALNLRIVHVRTAGQLADGSDLSPHMRAQGVCVVQDAIEAEFMPDVAPVPGELVLNKPGAGIYTGSGLDELLRNMGIEHLLLAGISFADGIESSIRSATDRGYGMVVVPDACAVYHPLLQDKLGEKESGIIQVMETDLLVEQLHTFASEQVRERVG